MSTSELSTSSVATTEADRQFRDQPEFQQVFRLEVLQDLAGRSSGPRTSAPNLIEVPCRRWAMIFRA
jgi:hypothetical protein